MQHRRSEWTGFYYDGRTAQRDQVAVTVRPDGLALRRSDDSEIHWPFDRLRQTQGAFSAERLRIEFGTDPVQALLVEQEGLTEAVREMAPSALARFQPRRNTARVVGWSVGALAVAAAAYLWGAPLLADALAPSVPVAWEARLGRSGVERLVPDHRRCADSVALADLRVVVDRLLAAAPPSSYDFHVYVARDASVNAFATPGGFLVVNTGLLAAAQTPEELAGVLAHEIQHVLHRHSTRAVIREVPLRLALAAISGGGGVETAASAIGTLGVLRYRRADEAEADRDGLRLLQAARVDPAGMVAFMRTLDARREDAPRVVSYLSGHPQTAARVAALEAAAAGRPAEWRPVLDPAAWARVRGMCGEKKGGSSNHYTRRRL